MGHVLLTLEFSLFLEGVSRFYYGKRAEGNGETPVGITGQLRPHRAVLEEAQRPPTESESFPAPLNSHNVSKLSLQELGAIMEKRHSGFNLNIYIKSSIFI